ncbi:MAG: DUF4012 domain-containing protein [Acidimicrobiia bacterium]|nr:DUF4012 domain-containing protein [Acidimicrobiia bacterium]
MTIDLRERSATLRITTPAVAGPRAPERITRPQNRRYLLMALIAVSAMGAALMSTASPAGVALADPLYRGTFAGVVVWFASRARRWTWPILAGLAAISTASLVAQIATFAALCVSIRALLTSLRRERITGALIATVCVPALLSQGSGPVWRLTGGEVSDPFASSAIITILATVPVIASGWKTLSRRRRREIRRQARTLALIVGALIAATLAVSAFAIPPMLRGLQLSQDATQAANDGDLETATEAFLDASEEWEAANRTLAGPWMTPGRLLPVLGQHVRASQVVTGQASALTTSAAAVTDRVDPDGIIVDGVIDIEEVDAITPAVDALAATTARADTKISNVLSPWLVPPVSERVERAVEVLGRTSGLVGASAEALHVGADLLGRNTPSQFLVMIATPAEARGSGGFIGNWALLESDNGALDVVEQYHSRELNALLASAGADLVAGEEYAARYARFDIERHIQDVTLSPDFPSVAPVAANLFLQATGVEVEAVLMLDPFVIEKLLGFTGPIDIDGDAPLTGANAAAELLIEQYERFDEDERRRETALLGLTGQLMDALVDNPPDPLSFIVELAPLAEQQRLTLWLADDPAGSIVERLGVSGAFPTSDDGLLSVVHQNAGQNKIDTYLDRSVDIRTTLNPGAGEVSHDVTITLTNSAPSTGLTDAVIGSNDQGLDQGTNAMFLSVYSSDRLRAATVNGQPAAIETASEFGQSVYSTLVTIPPGDFVVMELKLDGEMQSGDAYTMTLGAQPLASPDQVSWKLSTNDQSQVTPPPGWSTSPDGARWAAPLDRSETMRFSLRD